MHDFLKMVSLFADLPDKDLEYLCQVSVEEHLEADKILFTEGDAGEKAYVIMSGEVEIFKESDGRQVLLATRRAGEVIGEMSLLDQAPRFASGRTRTDSKLLAISHENLDHLLDASPSAARVILSTITNRLRSTELVLQQSEKMAQLGTLTAGIAHELNNPASAVSRGSEQLRSAFENFQQTARQFFGLEFSKEQWEFAVSLRETAKTRASKPDDLDNLGRSDREEQVEAWLEANQIENVWDYSPILVSLGYQKADLEALKAAFPAQQLALALRWFCGLFTIFSLLEQVHQGSSRISEIVRSLKSYVYLDQAQVQMIDIHDSLDNTLVMLRSKLKTGILLERHYAQDLPKIQAYGSELNQVWTNIIDNAVDAMDGKGSLKIMTSREGEYILVEIEDSGPGIPPEIQQKVFSPFFTTKPVGKGTGLGLNISFNIIQKHKGEIKIFSRPGKTRFSVRLPVNFEKIDQDAKPLPGLERPSDERLREILISTKTIAVMGASSHKSVPAHTVSSYLQNQAYRIIPVNPLYGQVLGETCYPDLLSIPTPVDLILVFQNSQAVAEIIQQAKQINVKVVWFYEGIADPAVSDTAKDAGLEVVLDTSIRTAHQRLILGGHSK